MTEVNCVVPGGKVPRWLYPKGLAVMNVMKYVGLCLITMCRHGVDTVVRITPFLVAHCGRDTKLVGCRTFT